MAKSKAWIQTYTGRKFFYDNIKKNKICIEDIAFALSNICRFTGHVRGYSVAQHSILVSQNVPPEDALWGLMHDASEAYAGDVNKPLKIILGSSYVDVESKIHRLVAKTWKLERQMPMAVHIADMRMLQTEKRDLFSKYLPWSGYAGIEPYEFHIKPWPASKSEKEFLARFKQLT